MKAVIILFCLTASVQMTIGGHLVGDVAKVRKVGKVNLLVPALIHEGTTGKLITVGPVGTNIPKAAVVIPSPDMRPIVPYGSYGHRVVSDDTYDEMVYGGGGGGGGGGDYRRGRYPYSDSYYGDGYGNSGYGGGYYGNSGYGNSGYYGNSYYGGGYPAARPPAGHEGRRRGDVRVQQAALLVPVKDRHHKDDRHKDDHHKK